MDHFVIGGSTVNMCSLDLSKAFDRLDHNILLNRLMDRRLPKCYLQIVQNWYSELFILVKWGNSFSKKSKITAGVRQGGILSPSCFSIVVDDILNYLEKSNLGCYIKMKCANSFMYADDIILLSISLNHMQKLVDICSKIIKDLHMKINVVKSSIIRIGPRFNWEFSPIICDNLILYTGCVKKNIP